LTTTSNHFERRVAVTVIFILVIGVDVALAGYAYYVVSKTGVPFVTQPVKKVYAKFSLSFNIANNPNLPPDVEVGVTIRSPNDTVIAGEPQSMDGIVVIITNQPGFINAYAVGIGFVNAESWPPNSVDKYGVPLSAQLYLTKAVGSNKTAGSGDDFYYFPIEGTYHPFVKFFRTNATGSYVLPFVFLDI